MAEKEQSGISCSWLDNHNLHIAFSWATFEGPVIPCLENNNGDQAI